MSRTTALPVKAAMPVALQVAAVVSSLLAVAPALAGHAVNTGYFGGIAIDGYDPVAYFTDNRAMKGSEQYSYEWLGTRWHFVSEQHRDMFKSDPVKYAPQYGGYCAGEVEGSGSTTVNIDPEAFKIIDDKLYLTYDKVHTAQFGSNPDDVAKADANWLKMKDALESYRQ
jgi:YHS domain-containing protein